VRVLCANGSQKRPNGTVISRLALTIAAIVLLAPLAAAQIDCSASPSPCVTLTGVLQASNGQPAFDYILSFKPSQMFYVAGSGAVVNTTVNCGTNWDGAVVGVPNPTQTVTISQQFTGTLSAGTYYVRYTYYASGSTGTAASPEQTVQLTAQGGLVINAPSGGIPSTAMGRSIYIGIQPGAEFFQGAVAGNGSYTQSVPIITGGGQPVPSSNNTVCRLVANDAGWPTGTGYQVGLTDQSGNTVPPYPMQWQLLGPNTTIDISSGLPYYHGVTLFPSPIVVKPPGGALQTIYGTLAVTGTGGAQGITPLSICPNGIPSSTTFCNGAGTWVNGTSGGLQWPGTTGVLFGRSVTTTRVAVSGDITALWGGTCSAATFLRGDGLCEGAPGGTVTTLGNLTAGVVPIANGSTQLRDGPLSTVTDTTPSNHLNIDGSTTQGILNLSSGYTSAGITFPRTSSDSGSAGLLYKLGSGITATKATTSDTGIPVYIAACNTSTPVAEVLLYLVGLPPCTFDNSTTVGDYVIASTSVAANCHDAGTSRPSAPVFIIGRVAVAGITPQVLVNGGQ
jgi:hypothetical protein